MFGREMVLPIQVDADSNQTLPNGSRLVNLGIYRDTSQINTLCNWLFLALTGWANGIRSNHMNMRKS